MKLTELPQYVKHAKRFTEIVSIPGGITLSELSQEARIRMALTELGPTFIKLGQILSTRADLVGPSLAKELSELQSGTPADPPDVVREEMVSELGESPEDLFAEFIDQAMGSASIGQVHGAWLHDGQPVVVKVQHKGIEDKVTADLEIMMAIAELAEKYEPDLRPYQPRRTTRPFTSQNHTPSFRPAGF